MTLLAPADVLKIKCRFVTEMIKFIKRKRYIMAPCLCDIYPYYADYLLSTYLGDCLEYEDECKLKKLSDSSSDQDPIDPDITPCDTQIEPVLSYGDSESCTYFVSVENQLDSSAYPAILLTDDSTLVNVTSDVILNNTCNDTVQTETIIGGCIDGTCSDDYQGQVTYSVGFRSYIHGSNAVGDDAYITTMRVYKLDSTGAPDPTPINLDLNFATSDYYTAGVDCPGCTTLDIADVKFGHANFEDNFKTLMDNVGLALFGNADTHRMTATKTSDTVAINTTVLHNPSGEMFGISLTDIYVQDYNTTSGTYALSTSTTGYGSGGIRLRNSLSFDLPCGTIEPVIKTTTTSVGMSVDWANTTFYEIKLLSLYANKPLYGVSGTTSDCVVRELKAVYTTSSDITSVEWLNPDLEVISTMDTAVAVDAGTYTFKIYLNTGCIIVRTISVPAV